MKAKLQTTILRDIGRSNNPANIDSLSAKKAGLSYWEYMAKKYNKVHQYVWGVKKVTRKQQRETNNQLISAMAKSNHPMMRLMAQMRALIGGRGAY